MKADCDQVAEIRAQLEAFTRSAGQASGRSGVDGATGPPAAGAEDPGGLFYTAEEGTVHPVGKAPSALRGPGVPGPGAPPPGGAHAEDVPVSQGAEEGVDVVKLPPVNHALGRSEG